MSAQNFPINTAEGKNKESEDQIPALLKTKYTQLQLLIKYLAFYGENHENSNDSANYLIEKIKIASRYILLKSEKEYQGENEELTISYAAFEKFPLSTKLLVDDSLVINNQRLKSNLEKFLSNIEKFNASEPSDSEEYYLIRIFQYGLELLFKTVIKSTFDFIDGKILDAKKKTEIDAPLSILRQEIIKLDIPSFPMGCVDYYGNRYLNQYKFDSRLKIVKNMFQEQPHERPHKQLQEQPHEQLKIKQLENSNASLAIEEKSFRDRPYQEEFYSISIAVLNDYLDRLIGSEESQILKGIKSIINYICLKSLNERSKPFASSDFEINYAALRDVPINTVSPELQGILQCKFSYMANDLSFIAVPDKSKLILNFYGCVERYATLLVNKHCVFENGKIFVCGNQGDSKEEKEFMQAFFVLSRGFIRQFPSCFSFEAYLCEMTRFIMAEKWKESLPREIFPKECLHKESKSNESEMETRKAPAIQETKADNDEENLKDFNISLEKRLKALDEEMFKNFTTSFEKKAKENILWRDLEQINKSTMRVIEIKARHKASFSSSDFKLIIDNLQNNSVDIILFRNIEISEEQMKIFSEHLALNRSLLKLVFKDIVIGMKAMEFLSAALYQNRCLQSLILDGTEFNNNSAKAFKNSFEKIKLLNFVLQELQIIDNYSNNPKFTAHTADIFSLHLNYKLSPKKIRLSGGLPVRPISIFAKNLFGRGAHFTPVEELNFSSNNLCDQGTIEFVSYLPRYSLLHLNLSHNRIGETGGIELAKYINSNRSLQELILSCNNFNQTVAKQFADALKTNITLRKLFLQSCQFGVENGDHEFARSADYFSEILKTNTTLEVLNISNNNFGVPGAKLIAEGIKENKFLRELALNDCDLRREGTQYIIDALNENLSLFSISLARNNIEKEGIDYLVNALMTKKIHLSLFLGFDLERTNIKYQLHNVELLKDNDELKKYYLRSSYPFEISDQQETKEEIPSGQSLDQITQLSKRIEVLQTEMTAIAAQLKDPSPESKDKKQYLQYDSYGILLACAQAMQNLDDRSQSIFPKELAKQFRNAIYIGQLFKTDDYLKRNSEIREMAETLLKFISERCHTLPNDFKSTGKFGMDAILKAIPHPIFKEIMLYDVPKFYLEPSEEHREYRILCKSVMDETLKTIKKCFDLKKSMAANKWTAAFFFLKARLGKHFSYFSKCYLNDKENPEFLKYKLACEKYQMNAARIRHNKLRANESFLPQMKGKTLTLSQAQASVSNSANMVSTAKDGDITKMSNSNTNANAKPSSKNETKKIIFTLHPRA